MFRHILPHGSCLEHQQQPSFSLGCGCSDDLVLSTCSVRSEWGKKPKQSSFTLTTSLNEFKWMPTHNFWPFIFHIFFTLKTLIFVSVLSAWMHRRSFRVQNFANVSTTIWMCMIKRPSSSFIINNNLLIQLNCLFGLEFWKLWCRRASRNTVQNAELWQLLSCKCYLTNSKYCKLYLFQAHWTKSIWTHSISHNLFLMPFAVCRCFVAIDFLLP